MGGWRDEWETTGYVTGVGTTGDSYRVRIRAERGRVTRYTVQFEVWMEGRFYPALRYDDAHGRSHRDTLDWTGVVVDKAWMPVESNADAATRAIKDIRANWHVYRTEEFERRKP